jgi:predicted nucleic acid-binding protein
MRRTAVIDNDSLVNLTKLKHLNIFHSLQFLFSRIHIPGEVRREYEIQLAKEPERAWVLEKLRPDEGFYSFCTHYDTFVLNELDKIQGIDKGEAEAVAQHKKVYAHYILSDDNKFKKIITKLDSRVKVFTTLHLIAMLDMHNVILNQAELIKTLYKSHTFNARQLRLAYIESGKEFGLALTKKQLNEKCDFKKLGLN